MTQLLDRVRSAVRDCDARLARSAGNDYLADTVHGLHQAAHRMALGEMLTMADVMAMWRAKLASDDIATAVERMDPADPQYASARRWVESHAPDPFDVGRWLGGA